MTTTYVKRETGHWQSCYADTYCYKDPSCFNKQMVYNTTPSIQNPSKNSVPSVRFQPNYIPRLMYCRPPGKGNHDAVSLNLGTFHSSAFTKKGKTNEEIRSAQTDFKSIYQFQLANIQRGYEPKIRRQQIIGKVLKKEAADTTEQDMFNYHNLIRKNRNSGCNLTSECELTHRKLTNSDKEKLAEIHHPAVWTTNTERSQLQSAIPIKNNLTPVTELEASSDTVRYKADRYNVNAEPWQRFSDKWDNVQRREREQMTRTNEVKNQKTGVDMDVTVDIDSDCEADERSPDCEMVPHSESRHLPGYSGYVPRLPITKTQTTSKRNFSKESQTYSNGCRRSTTMQRAFPNYMQSNEKNEKQSSNSNSESSIDSTIYSPYKSFARRGVMSNTITLVRPHNPFRLKPAAEFDVDELGDFKVDKAGAGSETSLL